MLRFTSANKAARWADTLGAPKISMVSFWPAVTLFAFLAHMSTVGVLVAFRPTADPAPAATIAFGALGAGALLTLLVAGRQHLRRVYDMPRGSWTIMEDALTLLLCFPCALVQEAHQVERVDPDPPLHLEDASTPPSTAELPASPRAGGGLLRHLGFLSGFGGANRAPRPSASGLETATAPGTKGTAAAAAAALMRNKRIDAYQFEATIEGRRRQR
mmetsp:Transcript_27189/g.78838  ORF Transcript_27189/g.78838 Transcript_27189/m.78838 type:complete len:216 (-) Transcript_27189:116-763(-)